MKITDLPHAYQDQIAQQLRTRHRVALPARNVESRPRNVTKGKDEVQEAHQTFDVHFRSIRKRLADPDGLSGKAALDALVDCGVFPDDSAKEIRSVTHSQRLARKGEREHTKIIITEANDTATT